MDFRDQQLHDFEESGTRCDMITVPAFSSGFDRMMRTEEWMPALGKIVDMSDWEKHPVESIFDGCPAPDNIEPEARPLTAPAQRKANLANRYDMIKDAVESKGEAS